MRECIHTYIHTHIHTYMHTYTHTYTHTYISISACVCVGSSVFSRYATDENPFDQQEEEEEEEVIEFGEVSLMGVKVHVIG